MIPIGPNTARHGSRATAALTALVLFVGSLLGLAHEAATAHVRCAEHGEMVHADGAAVTRLDASEADWQATARGIPAATGHGHGHDHCLLASAIHATCVTARSSAIATLATITRTTLALVPRGTQHRDLYRIAPKTSPPVA